LSADGILVFNAIDIKVEYCNNALARILEIPKESILNDSYLKLRRCLKDDDSFIEMHFRNLQLKSKLTNIELRVRSHKEKHVALDAYVLKNSSFIYCVVKDITKAKEHTNYIVEFGARKDAILDMLAHNLSGPLNLTSNVMDLIDQLNQAQNYKKIDTHTRLIRENTYQCIEIINSFLKEEHLASPAIHIGINRFDAIAKIKIVTDRIKQFHEQKQIKLITENKELFVSNDDVKFFQVIHNLLSNAVKFTAEKGKIVIKVINDDDTFSVSIADDGVGIPEFLQPYIFKKNTPAARAGLRGEKSIGMGLYIVKRLVELMRGELTFKSEEGKGSTFTVQFPKN
jgi:two-component system sensor histidine kinase VicK